MARMKSMRIASVNWCVHFEEVEGSYYDYVTKMWSSDKEAHAKIEQELLMKNWRLIKNSDNSLSIFEKDRYLIRISKLWGESNG